MASGSFERQFTTSRPADECWSVLTDVDRLASWVEIVHHVVTRSPLASYEATLEDRLGPFGLRADLQIIVTEASPPARMRFHASGDDRQVGSRLAVHAGMQLEEGDDGTRVRFDGTYQVEGRVASIGGPMIHRKANTVLEQFLSRAEKELS